MRPLKLILLIISLATCSASLVAQGCASTPEAAAKAALGTGGVGNTAGAGFRVQDVQFDPVMRRVWVRVQRCDNPSAPLVLVPFQAPTNTPNAQLQVAVLQTPQQASPTSSAATGNALVPVSMPIQQKQILVHYNDPVKVVFASSAVQMQLEATAAGQGGVGDRIEVILKRRPNQALDEPEHRMHGMVRADKSIEVQP